MCNEEKQIITTQRIRNELKGIVKGELFASAFFWLLLIVVNGVFMLTLYLLKGCAFAQPQAVQTILTVLGWVVWLAPIVYPVLKLFKSCRYFRMINNSEFHIVEDELVRMAKDEFNAKHFFTALDDYDLMARFFSSYEDAFYFERYGRVVVSSKLFDLASCGDTFYLVVTDKKDIPVLVYNTKMYEYKEYM